jgi:hypothetical protein
MSRADLGPEVAGSIEDALRNLAMPTGASRALSRAGLGRQVARLLRLSAEIVDTLGTGV